MIVFGAYKKSSVSFTFVRTKSQRFLRKSFSSFPSTLTTGDWMGTHHHSTEELTWLIQILGKIKRPVDLLQISECWTSAMPRMNSYHLVFASMIQPIPEQTQSGFLRESRHILLASNRKLIPWELHFLDRLTGKCVEISPSSSSHPSLCLGNKVGISSGYV